MVKKCHLFFFKSLGCEMLETTLSSFLVKMVLISLSLLFLGRIGESNCASPGLNSCDVTTRQSSYPSLTRFWPIKNMLFYWPVVTRRTFLLSITRRWSVLLSVVCGPLSATWFQAAVQHDPRQPHTIWCSSHTSPSSSSTTMVSPLMLSSL